MTTPISYLGADLTYGGALLFWGGVPVEQATPGGVDADTYARALALLLPSGPAWASEPGSVLQQLVLALAQEFARLDARAVDLVEESDPRTAAELLAEWERMYGLPDPCVEAPQTVAERRQALLGRVTAIGGQSRAFFIALAAALGYTVTITEFRSEAEAIAAGIPYTGTSWAHTWRVNVPVSVGVRGFAVGSSAVGEPLRSWGNEVLECQFQRFKPAHTSVLFAYAT